MVLTSFKPGSRTVLDTLRQLPHLGWALKETERTRPAAGLLMRYTVEPYEVGPALGPGVAFGITPRAVYNPPS